MIKKLERRTLTFSSLHQIMPEVDCLLRNGHTTLGQWSLGQIFNHLTDSMTFSVQGFPRLAPWIIRKTIGPIMLSRILKKGVFPSGLMLPKKFAPKPGAEPRAEAEALRAAINYYASYTGKMSAHPLSDKFTRAQWDRLHAIHCAHHLGFVLPNA